MRGGACRLPLCHQPRLHFSHRVLIRRILRERRREAMGPGPVAVDEIDVVELEGGRILRLTTGEGANWSPAWSPDGRIVFASNRYGQNEILSLRPPQMESP